MKLGGVDRGGPIKDLWAVAVRDILVGCGEPTGREWFQCLGCDFATNYPQRADGHSELTGHAVIEQFD